MILTNVVSAISQYQKQMSQSPMNGSNDSDSNKPTGLGLRYAVSQSPMNGSNDSDGISNVKPTLAQNASQSPMNGSNDSDKVKA